MGILSKIIKAISGDSLHLYEGKGGSYLKTGGSKSGRKGRTLRFSWWKK